MTRAAQMSSAGQISHKVQITPAGQMSSGRTNDARSANDSRRLNVARGAIKESSMKARRFNFPLFSMGILFLGLLIFSTYPPGVSLATEVNVDCDIQSGGCRKQINGRTVDLHIFPKPVKAMKDLTFQVKISGDSLSEAPFIDLSMPGMKMGPNRVILKKNGAATYEGQGVIVRCPSGKTIWQATVTLPDVGSVVFTFDVIY
jgi:hypothetical protein